MVARRRRLSLAQVRPSVSLTPGSRLRGCALLPRARGSDSSVPRRPPRATTPSVGPTGGGRAWKRSMSRSCTSSGSPRWIWARRGWRRACGCRTRTRPGRRVQELRSYAHDHGAVAGVGGLVALQPGHPGGDGVHQHYWKGVYYLLEAEGFECWWPTLGRSRTSRVGRRPTRSTRCGWQGRPSGACSGPRWCTPNRSAGCGTSPVTAARWCATGPGRQQRVEKLLEDAQIKLGSRDQRHLRGLRPGDARRAGRPGSGTRRCWPRWPAAAMRGKTAVLEEALTRVLHRPPRAICWR